MSEILIILTCKEFSEFRDLGGTGWWKVDASRVRRAGKVLIMHNANDPRKPGDPERHGHPVLMGTVRDVLQHEDGRCLIQFEEYALASGSFRWPGYRNPTVYMNEDEVLGGLEPGDWEPMPEVSFEEAVEVRRLWEQKYTDGATPAPSTETRPRPAPARSVGQIIEAHRADIATELGVRPESIRIVIEA